MKRGPKPKPNALRALQGRTAPSHGYREHEPSAEPGPFVTPDWLDDDARAIFDEHAPELERIGLLRPRYVMAFALWCVSTAQAQRAYRLLTATSPVIVSTRHGNPVSNPSAREFARFAELSRRFGEQFGMSPSAVTDLARRGDFDDETLSPQRLLS